MAACVLAEASLQAVVWMDSTKPVFRSGLMAGFRHALLARLCRSGSTVPFRLVTTALPVFPFRCRSKGQSHSLYSSFLYSTSLLKRAFPRGAALASRPLSFLRWTLTANSRCSVVSSEPDLSNRYGWALSLATGLALSRIFAVKQQERGQACTYTAAPHCADWQPVVIVQRGQAVSARWPSRASKRLAAVVAAFAQPAAAPGRQKYCCSYDLAGSVRSLPARRSSTRRRN